MIRTERLVLRDPVAGRACAAVLARADVDAPGEPVVLCTQSANVASVRP